jgi:hypothetical protein
LPTGGKQYDKAIEFITNKFHQQCDSKSKQIYTHVTIATNTDNILTVFNIAKDIVLRGILKDVGIGL